MNGALPFGLLMFVGLFVALVARRMRRDQAARRFPSLANQLGLAFVPPSARGAVGRLSGTLRGRKVLVDPDDQRLIAVRFAGAPRVDFRNYEAASLRAPFGMVTAYSGDRAFDRFFKTRFASEEIVDRIAASERPGDRVAPFEGRYSRQVKSLSVTSDGVNCRLDFGSPPHIPVGAVEQLLPACADLADLIEGRGDCVQSPSGENSSKASR